MPLLSLLVVDDHRTAADATALLLRREGHEVEVSYDGAAAIQRLHERRFDLVLTDLRMEPIDGLAVVRAARASTPPVDAIVFTAFGSVEAAVEAMRIGALDFLTKPVSAGQILSRVRNIHASPAPDSVIIGDSAQTVELRDQAAKLARVRSTVLISGETGTGRRHLARWLHQHGLDTEQPLLVARPNQPFAADDLHGAGTILVPSVDTWSDSAQAGLLRQLEGLEAGMPPRLIATANPDIDVKAARGEIPPELYFRLAVLVVRLAPLHKRPDDLGPLLRHFLEQAGQVFAKAPPRLLPHHLSALQDHSWPGNVREVANLAERAVVLGESAFNMNIKPARPGAPEVPPLGEGFVLSDHLEAIERSLLERALAETRGDRPAMGRILGLERNTLRYKLNKYGLIDRS